MTIGLDNFREVDYQGRKVFFDKNYQFHKFFGHKRKTIKFPFHKTLLEFIEDNPMVKICFTLDRSIDGFKKLENGEILINIESYIKFCKSLESNTRGRAKAFLGQHIKASNIISDIEKSEIIKGGLEEDNIKQIFKDLSPETRTRIIDTLKKLENNNIDSSNISKEDFLSAFTKFLSDERVQSAFLSTLPKVQIETLKQNKKFIEDNLDKNEIFFQNWIDEDSGKYRKQRCLVFGVEYVDPKREGEFMRKRFDILAEQNRLHHVLIELKSPTAEVFKVETKENRNGGKTTEYRLSDDLARAIPQILGYKKWYESARSEEIQALGIPNKKTISKCIIVIGVSSNDQVWSENFEALKNSISIEIWTYTDLIDKLQNTISNLEESS